MKITNVNRGMVWWNDDPPRVVYFAFRLSQALGVLAGFAVAANCLAAADAPKVFVTPENAVAALTSAARSEDPAALRLIFGPALDQIRNPDPVQATNELARFAAALTRTNRLVRSSASRYELEVGPDLWPFPIPLVKEEEGWFFDTVAGKDELLNRRIGRNELLTLATVRAYVQAQREYASRDHNGDEVLEYAQRLISSPGTKDGLYWSPDLDGEISPLGPMVAEAQSEGYRVNPESKVQTPTPYHGYYFKILKRQGIHAPGGKYSYVINGHMIAGFALVAWPAEYGESGIMTFVVNQQGRVYQKDLGPNTSKLAAELKAYDPDSSWQLSPD